METGSLTTPAAAASEAYCPQCGRFVGAEVECPSCGTRVSRLPLRWLKVAAAAIAAAGLLLLWWAARRASAPLVTAAEVQGTMNFAYVQLQGQVVGSRYYDAEGAYLSFWVDDGTGEVRVAAYRDVTTDLVKAGDLPAPGDRITVAGTLRVREDDVALTINAPEELAYQRPPPLPLPAGEVTVLDEGRRVSLSGEVQRVYSPYEGLTLLTLADESGEIVVALDDVPALLAEPEAPMLPEFAEGQYVAVTGTVSLYRGTPQIVPATVADLALLAAAPTVAIQQVTQLQALSAADVGTYVEVQGRVALLESFKGGVKAYLDDGTGQVLLLLWTRLHDALDDPAALDAGAEVIARGEVQVYNGELEVVPEEAGDVQVTLPAPEPPWVAVGELDAGDVGRVVRVRGVLGGPQGFSAGVKVPLEEGDDTLTLLLWANLYEQLQPRPAEGMRVEVVGVLNVYRGHLELAPRSRHDWRVGAP